MSACAVVKWQLNVTSQHQPLLGDERARAKICRPTVPHLQPDTLFSNQETTTTALNWRAELANVSDNVCIESSSPIAEVCHAVNLSGGPLEPRGCETRQLGGAVCAAACAAELLTVVARKMRKCCDALHN